MNFNQLKRLADKCVFSVEGVTIIKTEEYEYRLQQIEQLTNNWNELEKFCNSRIKSLYGVVGTLWQEYQEVLDKMKEIKDSENNE